MMIIASSTHTKRDVCMCICVCKKKKKMLFVFLSMCKTIEMKEKRAGTCIGLGHFNATQIVAVTFYTIIGPYRENGRIIIS